MKRQSCIQNTKDFRESLDKQNIFEKIRKDAEDAYKLNPNDVNNLMKWGDALLELSQFHNVSDSIELIQDAIKKLVDALSIDPTKVEAVWCMGNGYFSLALLTTNDSQTKVYFALAYMSLGYALFLQPDNELYLKSFKMVDKTIKNMKNSDVKSKKGRIGWGILAIGVVASVSMAFVKYRR